jgi:hypothetical protein
MCVEPFSPVSVPDASVASVISPAATDTLEDTHSSCKAWVEQPDVDPMTPLEETCFLSHHAMPAGIQSEYLKHLRIRVKNHTVIRVGVAFAGCDVLSKSLKSLSRVWKKTLSIDVSFVVEWACEYDLDKQAFLQQQFNPKVMISDCAELKQDFGW